MEPCPCCGATASASPHPELRFACDVCGGPRVPRRDPTLRSSGREVPLLRKADAARKARAGWRAASIADGLLLTFAVILTGVTALVFGAGIALGLITAFFVAPVAAFLAFAIHRATVRGHEIAPALDAAWLAVGADVAQQTPGLTASVLAQKLGIEEPQAEELMALLDVNGAMVVPRLRIEEQGRGAASAAAGSTEIAAASEEEAALAERIDAVARARLGPGAGKP